MLARDAPRKPANTRVKSCSCVASKSHKKGDDRRQSVVKTGSAEGAESETNSCRSASGPIYCSKNRKRASPFGNGRKANGLESDNTVRRDTGVEIPPKNPENTSAKSSCNCASKKSSGRKIRRKNKGKQAVARLCGLRTLGEHLRDGGRKEMPSCRSLSRARFALAFAGQEALKLRLANCCGKSQDLRTICAARFAGMPARLAASHFHLP